VWFGVVVLLGLMVSVLCWVGVMCIVVMIYGYEIWWLLVFGVCVLLWCIGECNDVLIYFGEYCCLWIE